jgi:hypothetical protein
MFSKKKKIKILKTKRLFSFIIAYYSKSLNSIQFFREAKRRNRLTLRDFHHIFQNVIAARQKNLEFDSDYNSFLVQAIFISHLESILSKVNFQFIQRYRFVRFKSSFIVFA